MKKLVKCEPPFLLSRLWMLFRRIGRALFPRLFWSAGFSLRPTCAGGGCLYALFAIPQGQVQPFSQPDALLQAEAGYMGAGFP